MIQKVFVEKYSLLEKGDIEKALSKHYERDVKISDVQCEVCYCDSYSAIEEIVFYLDDEFNAFDDIYLWAGHDDIAWGSLRESYQRIVWDEDNGSQAFEKIFAFDVNEFKSIKTVNLG